MTLENTTHLNFTGNARAALEFYRSVFGGELMIVTYADVHNVERPEEADLVTFGQLRSDNGFRVMAYDVPASREYAGGVDPFFESVRADSVEAASEVWDKLLPGAVVKAPFGPSAWTPGYGMLTDRFGVTWVVDVAVSYPAT